MTKCVLFTMRIFWLSIFSFIKPTLYRTMLIWKYFFLIFFCIIRLWRPVLYAETEDALAFKKGRISNWNALVHTLYNVLPAMCNTHWQSITTALYSPQQMQYQCIHSRKAGFGLCTKTCVSSSFARLDLFHYEQPFRNVVLCVLHALVSLE